MSSQSQGQSKSPCAAVAALARHLNLPLAAGAAGADSPAATAGTGCCSWPGVACTADNANVKSIAWPRQSLQGNLTTLPPLDSDPPLAAALEVLDLAGNPLIVGSIPASGSGGTLALLTGLRSLSLASTGISGAIPPNSLPPSLIALDLSSTNLAGPIPPFPKSISACTLASPTANYTCYPPSSFPSACRSSLPASLPACPTPGPFDNFQWTSDVIILIAASITVTLALISMIVVCYRWDRVRDQAVLEKDQLLGELRRIRVQQASALGVDPALEALGPHMARAAIKRSSMASSSAAAAGDGSAPSTPGTGAGVRVSYVSEQGGVRASYDPYDPRWSYPSTPGSHGGYDPHAPAQRASYLSSSYAASPTTALWPHSDATPPPGAPAAMGVGGVRQSWPVYPPSSSVSATSSPAPLLPATPAAAAISSPPPVSDLAATPTSHPHLPSPEPHKRHSLLSAFRTAMSASKWTRRRSAPPQTLSSPVLMTTEPLKSHDAADARPESWIGTRSMLPPSVIEYRALDTLEHGQDVGLGDVDEQEAVAAPASLVAQYPQSEAEMAARSRVVSAAGTPAGSIHVLAGDQASSARWLPSADHRLSVSGASAADDGGESMRLAGGMPVRQNSGESGVQAQAQAQAQWGAGVGGAGSPLAGNVVPGRVEMDDVARAGRW